MTRHQAALMRLALSRQRLSLAVAGPSPAGTAPSVLHELMRQHPWGAVLSSLLLGSLLARLRPWRWALAPGLWAALLPALMPTLTPVLTALLSKVATEGWAALQEAMESLFGRQAQPQPPTAAQPPSATTHPPA